MLVKLKRKEGGRERGKEENYFSLHSVTAIHYSAV
jgi:hypothetical protein